MILVGGIITILILYCLLIAVLESYDNWVRERKAIERYNLEKSLEEYDKRDHD